MKCRLTQIFVLLLALMPRAFAQRTPPFIVTAFGGLFFPSNPDFKETFKSSSDLIYGFGISLPIQSTLFFVADYSFFKPEALLNTSNDSSLSLDERIIHVGLLNKQPLTGTLFLRFSGGLNLITIKQHTSSAQSPEQTVEADRRIGYFGGIGIEQLSGDPHISFFGDVIYDYRRSRQRILYGDFGGLRAVIGAHFYLF